MEERTPTDGISSVRRKHAFGDVPLSLSLCYANGIWKKAHLSITHANQLIRCRQPVWFFFQRRISLPTGGYRMKRPGNTISDISRPLILAHRKIILVRNRSPWLHEANTAIFHLISLRLMSREEATTQSHRIFLVRAMWANQLGSRSPSRQQWPIQLQAADKGKQWQVGQVSRAPPDSVFGNRPEWGRILTLHRLPFNGKLTSNQVAAGSGGRRPCVTNGTRRVAGGSRDRPSICVRGLG